MPEDEGFGLAAYLVPVLAGLLAGAAGDPAKAYYSFDIGAWHVVALNSNCSAVGGCLPLSRPRFEIWLSARSSSRSVATKAGHETWGWPWSSCSSAR